MRSWCASFYWVWSRDELGLFVTIAFVFFRATIPLYHCHTHTTIRPPFVRTIDLPHMPDDHIRRGENTITAFVIFLLLIDFKSIVTIRGSLCHHWNKNNASFSEWVIKALIVTIQIFNFAKCHHCCSLHRCLHLDCLLLGEFPFVHREYSRDLNFKLYSFEIFQSSWSPTIFSSQYLSSLQGYFFPPPLCSSNPGRVVRN